MADANIRAVITAEDHASRALSTFGDHINGLSRNAQTAHGSFLGLGSVIGITAGIASNVFGMAVSGVTSLVGDAIKRVDTLGNASHVFSDMGFKTIDTQKAMAALDKSIRGLPTSLNEAVTNVQLLAVATGDIGKSQKIFSALNDAIIGTGGTAEQVKGSVVQLSQAFSNGKIDAQTWNSLIQNMGPALGAVAKSMHLTMGQLKEGLSNGTISVEQFQDALINMDTKGGGGMKSFRDMALDAVSGIGTGFTNMKTSITRGLADIINAIGKKNISNAIADIGKGIETGAKIFAKHLPEMVRLIKELWNWFKNLFPVFQMMINPLLTIANHFNTIKTAVINLVNGIENLYQRFMNLTVVQIIGQYISQVLWPALQALWAAIIQNLVPALEQFWTAITKLWNSLNPALMTAIKIIAAILLGALLVAIWAVISVLNVIIQVFSFVISIISNVIGWVANLIGWFGNLVGGVINVVGAIISWFGQLPGYIGNIISAVISWFASLPGRILNALGNLGSLLWNVGVAIIEGLFNGIKAKFEAVKNFISGIGTWIKDHKGPIDYDKTLLIDNGAAIMEGLNKGLTAGFNVTKSITHDVTGSLGNIGESQQTNIQRTNHTHIHISPHIGVFTGSAIERRKLAMLIFGDLKDIGLQRNTNILDLLKEMS
jgi:tape measure domain-containing protein